MIWTNSQQALLEHGAESGLSVRQISTTLGVTRNAVIGRATRTGVKIGHPPKRLTASEVAAIAHDLALGTMPLYVIAERHDVRVITVTRINSGACHARQTGASFDNKIKRTDLRFRSASA